MDEGSSKNKLAVDNLLPHSVSDSNAAGKRATTPEITIHTVSDNQDVVCASNYNHARIISHSSSEVDNKNCQLGAPNDPLSSKKRAMSEQDLTLGITSSQSESALKSITGNKKFGISVFFFFIETSICFSSGNQANTSSPSTTATKEVLSPFSKFAKGFQNLGANLDPRKLKSGTMGSLKNISDHHLEQRHELQERWENCNSKLIAL